MTTRVRHQEGEKGMDGWTAPNGDIELETARTYSAVARTVAQAMSTEVSRSRFVQSEPSLALDPAVFEDRSGRKGGVSDETTPRPRQPATTAGLALARQSLYQAVTIDQILDIEDQAWAIGSNASDDRLLREVDRLRAIEEAARAMFAADTNQEAGAAERRLRAALAAPQQEAEGAK